MSTSEGSTKTNFSLWFVLSRIFSTFLLIVPIVAAVSQPKLMQGSDFTMTFYVAGRMILDGRAHDLYPALDATSLLTTQFNQYAHQILNALAVPTTAVYMYSPLTAAVFVPFGLLTPQWALITWQVLSIVAIAVCALCMKNLTLRAFGSFFWLSILFFPVFNTMLIGHLGIIFGMLPLTLGFFLLMQNRPLMAGFCLSLLILKPQFLPTALLIAGALALTGRARCTIGLLSGMAIIAVLAVVIFSPSVMLSWLHSFQLSDTIFSDARYGYPKYLVCSLPGVVVQTVPLAFSKVAKLVTYTLAAGIGLHALIFSRNLIKKQEDATAALPMVFLIGLVVLVLVLPHLLFYDLCVLSIAGMIVFGYRWGAFDFQLRAHAIIGWLLCNLYMILWMFIRGPIAQPGLLVLGLGWLYWRFLTFLKQCDAPQQYSISLTPNTTSVAE